MKTKHQKHERSEPVKEPVRPSRWRRVCGPLPISLWEALVAREQAYEEDWLGHHLLALSVDAGQACALGALSGIIDCLAESAAATRKAIRDDARHGDGFAQHADELRELQGLERRVLRVMQRVAALPVECRGFACGGKNPPTTTDATGNRMCADCATASNGLLTAMSDGLAAAMRDGGKAPA